VGAFTATDKRETSAAGTEFMNAAHQAMIFLFQGTRDQIGSTLKNLACSGEPLMWECVGCGT
jgi:hypothetical protein